MRSSCLWLNWENSKYKHFKSLFTSFNIPSYCRSRLRSVSRPSNCFLLWSWFPFFLAVGSADLILILPFQSTLHPESYLSLDFLQVKCYMLWPLLEAVFESCILKIASSSREVLSSAIYLHSTGDTFTAVWSYFFDNEL